MKNCFKDLGIEPGLVLAEGALQAAYDEGSRERHPDAGGRPEAFQELTASYRELRHPGKRLAHWLDLQAGGFQKDGSLPGPVMALFGELGSLFAEIDAVLAKRREGRSALVQALTEREMLGLLPRLQEARSRIDKTTEDYVGTFADLEAAARRGHFEEAQETARALVFLEKWQGEARERWARLAG